MHRSKRPATTTTCPCCPISGPPGKKRPKTNKTKCSEQTAMASKKHTRNETVLGSNQTTRPKHGKTKQTTCTVRTQADVQLPVTANHTVSMNPHNSRHRRQIQIVAQDNLLDNQDGTGLQTNPTVSMNNQTSGRHRHPVQSVIPDHVLDNHLPGIQIPESDLSEPEDNTSEQSDLDSDVDDFRSLEEVTRSHADQLLLPDQPVPAISTPHGRTASSHPRQLSKASLNRAVHHILSRALAPSTTTTYRNALKKYRDFHTVHYPGDRLLPISVEKLSQFIAASSSHGLKHATIATTLSAISYLHNLQNLPNPTQTFLIKQLMHSIRKQSVPDKRLPVTLHILRLLTKALKQVVPSGSLRFVFHTMFLVAFFGLLRISELTVSKHSSKNAIKRQDVSFEVAHSKARTALITLTHFKHSQGQSAHIVLRRQNIADLCPVRHLYKYCNKYSPEYGSTCGPLFRFPTGCPISTSSFNAVIKQCVEFCSLDPARYTAHSFRIGGATYAHSLGFSTSQIQMLGRWKSSAFWKYIRPNPL